MFIPLSSPYCTQIVLIRSPGYSWLFLTLLAFGVLLQHAHPEAKR
jgi:hypothetical protein